PLPLTPMLNPFFSQNRAQCILYGFGEGSPHRAFVIRNCVRTSYGFEFDQVTVKMANVQCNNSIRSLKETPFSRRTNEDTLTAKHRGPPKPNGSSQQVSTKGGTSYIQEMVRKKIVASRL